MTECILQKVLTLHPESKKTLLNKMLKIIRPGDILMFYHRTSWRSRWIKRITGCAMPHMCIYQGRQRIVGMLKGRVCTHRIGRFFKNEYDLQIFRADPQVLDYITKNIGKKESHVDLLFLWLQLLLSYLMHRDSRNFIPYKMRGVTCSGIVSSALHLTYELPSAHSPYKDTPRDVESVIHKLNLDMLGNFSLIPEKESYE